MIDDKLWNELRSRLERLCKEVHLPKHSKHSQLISFKDSARFTRGIQEIMGIIEREKMEAWNKGHAIGLAEKKRKVKSY